MRAYIPVLLGLTLAWAGCGKNEAPSQAQPPAKTDPAPSVNLQSTPTVQPGVQAPTAPTLPPASSMEPEPQGFDPKEIARVIQVLDWHAENFASKYDKIPTIAELQAWKDPNFPFPFKAWPSPPPGKKWVINPQSGQFRLEDSK